ncbi:MAG TPA: IniB N-terminal domain-containing protein [Mycobacterium sp.]|nr:IniB N-terminal domain-containing protein [Mycobacterium sp.]
MSILDYTTGLFREPDNLRAFIEDPHEALREAGLPDATPEQVHDLLPLVAESMPADHPLQTVVRSDDPESALQALDIDDLIADTHDHHREVEQIQKALGGPETVGSHAQAVQCTPDAHQDVVIEPATAGGWHTGRDSDKALGEAPEVYDNPLTPEVEGPPEPAEDYPKPDDDQVAHELVEPDFNAVVWGKALE